MDLKFVITLVVVAVTFAGFGVAALCYIFVCRKIYKTKIKNGVSNGSSKLSNGYPKMPHFKAAARDIQVVQMMQKDQYSRYAELTKASQDTSYDTGRAHSLENILIEGKPRKKDGYKRLDRTRSQQTFFFNKSPPPHVSSDEAINCTEYYYPQADTTKQTISISTISPQDPLRDRRQKFIAKRSRRSKSVADPPTNISELIKSRYKSETDISMPSCVELGNDTFACPPSHLYNLPELSALYPAEGQVEFELFYNTESKTLDITIHKLLNVTLNPAYFIGTLETVAHDDTDKLRSKVYLKEHEDNSVELILNCKVGYIICVTLLPKMHFKRRTSVVYGAANILFNEFFSLPGYSCEQLNQLQLCFHVLTQFGNEGEPIIIGEIKVPLEKLEPSQPSPYLMEMKIPNCGFELEENPLKQTTLGELQVVISYNPMIHQLVVKVIQATGIPKITMTGNPNVSVKISLYYCGSRMNKQSTTIHKRQKEPVFNETFQFDISKDRISECDLLFEVRHHGPMHRTVIGYVNVGKSAGGTGANHWRELFDFSHFEKVHRIMPNKPAGFL